ncbi:MAG: hypothetical protein CR997_10970 [Acidobacteria bacterium]|nr:MAG: hypothetical protein CR997_10970 [Acidobacteriota bacterium]
MFFLFLWIYVGLQNEVDIQLRGLESYTGFKMKQANTIAAFPRNGRLTVAVGDLHDSFEIIGPDDVVWFLGVWSQYVQNEEIEIDVQHRGFAIYEMVSANRIKQLALESPAEVTVIRPEDQQEKTTQLTTDLLKENAQIHLQKTNLGGGSPIIRGMSGNRVLYLVDGFRINNGTYRLGLNQYLNSVPAEAIGQIEVLGGPSGVQYGSDGLGGTIQLLTADLFQDRENGIGFEQYVSTSDGTHIETALFNWNSASFSALGHLKHNSFSNLMAGSPVNEQIPTGYDQLDGSLNLGFKLGPTETLSMTNLMSSAEDIPRTDRIWSGKDLLWTYSPQDFRLHGIRFKSDRPHFMWDAFEFGTAWMRQEEGRNRISAKKPDIIRHSYNTVDTTQVNATFNKFISRHQLIYGFDYAHDTVDSWASKEDKTTGETTPDQPKFPDDSRYTQYGAFLIDNWNLSGKMTLRAGLRYAKVRHSGTLTDPLGLTRLENDNLSPVLSFSYKTGKHFLSVSATQGFRAPNLEDALSAGFSNKGFDAPNPFLQPETVWNGDLTYRYRSAKVLFQSTLYTAVYDNLIERVPSTWQGDPRYQGEDVFMMDNVGRAEVWGAGLSLLYKLPLGWTLDADLALTRGTQTEKDEPMTRIPPLRGHFQLRWDCQPCRFAVDVDFAGHQNRLSPDDLNDTRIPATGTPGYAAIHLRSFWQMTSQLKLNASIENLGDKLYKQHGSGIYEPGRRFVLQLSYRSR